MYEIAYGSKYQDNQDIKEIAKCVRKDIKQAIKQGDLPEGLKVSVRISRYSMGQSLGVTINALPVDFVILKPEFVDHLKNDSHRPFGTSRFTDEMTDVLNKIEKIYGAYNYDGSDIQSDYFNVNFYGSVNVASALESACKERTLAKLEGKPEPKPEPKPKAKTPLVTDAQVGELVSELCKNPDTIITVAGLSRGRRALGAAWTGRIKKLVRDGIVEVAYKSIAGNNAYRLAKKEEVETKEQAKVEKAAELGKAAFDRGADRVPAGDSELMKLLEGYPVGEGVPLLDAWIEAWDKANLAAPVTQLRPEQTQAEKAAELGKAAFENGIKLAIYDNELVELLQNNLDGEDLPLLVAWQKAWDTASQADQVRKVEEAKQAKVEKAAELGKVAFENGTECNPTHDSELMELLAGNQKGESLPLLIAWCDAWQVKAYEQ